MEDKDPEQNPLLGIAEALHLDIGNGAFWEQNEHLFLLRSPDPSKELDARLVSPDSRDKILQQWANNESAPLETVETEIEDKSGFASEPEVAIETPVIVEIPVQEKVETGPIPTLPLPEELTDPRPKRKKKSAPTIGLQDVEQEPEVKSDPPMLKAKPPKTGKLIRKAAKSVRKKEEEQKEQAKTQRIPFTDSSLSPFTFWLKGLKGSDYVHPYDDDYAFHQGAGPAKEGISETFADLLASQGYKEQAMEMYLKLIEKYPEKSGFFAAKIEALQ